MVKIRPNKKVILSVLAVLGVVVVAGAAGFGFRYAQDHNTDVAKNGKRVGQPLPKNVDEAQELRLKGDTDGALKKVDESLADSNTSKVEKYQLYIQQGNAYIDKKDYTAGINAYLQAEKIKQTYEITSLLAVMYEESGNTAKAIEYYEKSIPLIPSSPMKGSYKAQAEDKIKQLKGQG